MKTIEKLWTDYMNKAMEQLNKAPGHTIDIDMLRDAVKPHFVAGALSILTELAEGPFQTLMLEGTKLSEEMHQNAIDMGYVEPNKEGVTEH